MESICSTTTNLIDGGVQCSELDLTCSLQWFQDCEILEAMSVLTLQAYA